MCSCRTQAMLRRFRWNGVVTVMWVKRGEGKLPGPCSIAVAARKRLSGSSWYFIYSICRQATALAEAHLLPGGQRLFGEQTQSCLRQMADRG